jgi:ATP-binding cassette subfamily F protein uup
MAPLLQMQDIGFTLGGTPVLVRADLSLERGERLCLVGRNGSGKSTLLKIAAGLIEPDRGSLFRQPDASVRYLAQEPDFSGFDNVLAWVEEGLGPADDPFRARRLLEALGLSGAEHPSTLSGGEARRAALARTLAPEPDILLLDEPTNHLDLPAIEWLEAELAASRSAIVLVSHDRRFLTNLSRATVWLERGETRRLDRGFGAFEAWRDTVLDEEETAAQKLDRKIVAEEHWMRYGVTARRKRNMRRVGALADLRRAKREARRTDGGVRLAATDAGISGRLVIEAETIAKSFEGRPIVRDLSTRIMRGDRLGFVGPNGAGKTTAINLLTGTLEPDSGRVRLGANVAMASLDQSRASLDPDTTLADALTGGGSDHVEVAGARKHVVGYMRDFLFRPEQARTPIGRLSGGERARLMLARALALPSNLLVLDEPTNDLDLETLDLVEDFLGDYPGTVIVVSHDRDFLDRVATSVLVAEGDGVWIEYAGGYTDMVAQRGAGLGPLMGQTAPRVRAEKAATPASATPSRKKLGFREKHALETLPREIERLREKRDALRRSLDDPTLYARDPKSFGMMTTTLAEVEIAIAAAEDRWLELELLREEIEGAQPA